jgi:hypothetical protein
MSKNEISKSLKLNFKDSHGLKNYKMQYKEMEKTRNLKLL